MSEPLNNNPLSELFTSLKSYLDLRLDDVKLSAAEHLAKVVSKFLYLMVMFFVISLALGFFCVLLSRWVSRITNSDLTGPLCIFGLLVAMAVAFYLFRNRLFVNHNLRIFIEMFFGKGKEE